MAQAVLEAFQIVENHQITKIAGKLFLPIHSKNNANSRHFKASSDPKTDLENVSEFLFIEMLRTGLKSIANDIGFSL